jgi:cytochrome c556
MPQLPERKYVKVTLGGVSHTVPEDDLSYYTRAGYLREGEKPNEANLTPAERRMAQIARGEQPTNQASSVNLANVDVPASAEEIAATVIYGSPGGPNVPGPAASDEAVEDAEEVEAEEEVVTDPAPKKKKAGK